MKALVYTGAGTVQLEERPHPGEPAEGELLVRVKVCGVCGSDVTDWYMLPRAPSCWDTSPLARSSRWARA